MLQRMLKLLLEGTRDCVRKEEEVSSMELVNRLLLYSCDKSDGNDVSVAIDLESRGTRHC
jgi:hypothetical protein